METIIITKLSDNGQVYTGHSLIKFMLYTETSDWTDDMVFEGADRNLYTPEDLVGKKIQIITEFCIED